MAWSQDGSWLVYQLPATGGPIFADYDIFGHRPSRDSVPLPIVVTDAIERRPTISPDGRWMAYESNLSGRFEIYVKPFPNVDEARWKVSAEGGEWPAWAHNGHELFYVNRERELISVRYETEPSFAVVGGSRLFSVEGIYFNNHINAGYAVSVDDERFLMLQRGQSALRGLSLTLNLFEELHGEVGDGG
jgi:serine/threonine-protein kinase